VQLLLTGVRRERFVRGAHAIGERAHRGFDFDHGHPLHLPFTGLRVKRSDRQLLVARLLHDGRDGRCCRRVETFRRLA